MRTVVLDPFEVDAMLARRRRSGADRFDEVWNGEYHVVPLPSGTHADLDQQLAVLLAPLARAAGLWASGQCNVGVSDNDFRGPDRALHRERPAGVWNATVAAAVEIVSPGDESWQKLDFYAAHRVDEVVIVDPAKRSVDWLALVGGGYKPVERSRLLDIAVSEFAGRIDWPPTS
jgi:hypothetical protein